eukprot:CAMPEP_0195295610 /NCGR_PEP_ID=MMETSP0707-20130614/17693_1 /TAXON_ID=33640 /ORGANISM="Asterionellopsis glacialis, Strain CCMP134" /LENGTH=510 /DNA_ID=CAMNT_0040356869 /DNA_START=45 /DNA_END=1577 /DNA_ORIENTATION=-
MKHEMKSDPESAHQAPSAQGDGPTQRPVAIQMQQGGYPQLLVPTQIQSVVPIMLPIIYPNHSSVSNSLPISTSNSNIGQNALNYSHQIPSTSSGAGAERAEECKITPAAAAKLNDHLPSKRTIKTSKKSTINKDALPHAQKPDLLGPGTTPGSPQLGNPKRVRRILRARKHPALPTAASRSPGGSQQQINSQTKRSLETQKNDEDDAERIPNGETIHIKAGNISASSDKAAMGSTITSAAEEVLNRSTQLAYSWESLGLGKELGSPALNEYVRLCRSREGLSNENLPSVTAQQVLQIIQSFQLKTLLPPPGSDLHRIVKKNPFENRKELYGSEGESECDNESEIEAGSIRDSQPLPYLQGDFEAENHYGDGAPESSQLAATTTTNDRPKADKHKTSQRKPNLSPRPKKQRRDQVPHCNIPLKKMARLYELMCAQDADDGSTSRREAQYLTAEACVDKLRSFENMACELKLEETKVLQRGRKFGLTTGLLPDYSPYNQGSKAPNPNHIHKD